MTDYLPPLTKISLWIIICVCLCLSLSLSLSEEFKKDVVHFGGFYDRLTFSEDFTRNVEDFGGFVDGHSVL